MFLVERCAGLDIGKADLKAARFPDAGPPGLVAGMCPGNNESAGKHFSGRTRKGDRWLRAALGEAAAAGVGTKDSYCQAHYRRLAGRRGKKRALVAVGHSMLIAAWHIINDETSYEDLGPQHFRPARPDALSANSNSSVTRFSSPGRSSDELTDFRLSVETSPLQMTCPATARIRNLSRFGDGTANQAEPIRTDGTRADS